MGWRNILGRYPPRYLGRCHGGYLRGILGIPKKYPGEYLRGIPGILGTYIWDTSLPRYPHEL